MTGGGKEMKTRSLIIFSLFLISIAGVLVSASVPIEVIAPQVNEVYHTGQNLILLARYVPNTTATIYLITPTGEQIPEGAFMFNSSGYLELNFGTFGSGNLAIPGNYSLEIEVNGGEQGIIVPFIYKQNSATIIVYILNENGLPIKGATVYLYNATSLVDTETTNTVGTAIFQIIAPNTAEYFKVVASAPGYLNASKTFSIIGNETKSIVLTLYPAVLNIYAVEAVQNGITIDPYNPVGYSSLVATEGSTVTVYIKIAIGNMNVSNASVKVLLTTPENKSEYNAISLNNGIYKVSFYLPLFNTSYSVVLNISAKYSKLSGTVIVPIVVQLNYTEIENRLESQIITLEKNVSTLENETAKLTSALTKLENETATLEKTTNSLQKTTLLLDSEISSLNNQLFTLNKKIDQLTPIIYGALIAGVIGVVLAALALNAVRRALS